MGNNALSQESISIDDEKTKLVLNVNSVSTNLPPTAYIKMIDCWLIFGLLKPMVDIILQTYLQSLRGDMDSTKVWTEDKRDKKTKFCRIFLRVIYPTIFTLFV